MIRDAQKDPARGLSDLLESYRNYLWVLARGAIGRDLQAKLNPSDVVQETMFKAHERFGQFRGVSEQELISWLRRILIHHLASFARRFQGPQRDLGRERSLERVLDQSSMALHRLLANPGPGPSREAEQRDLKVQLADALARLKPEHREVIVLRSLQELDWKEIAHFTGRTAGASRVLWVRALKRLEPLLEGLR